MDIYIERKLIAWWVISNVYSQTRELILKTGLVREGLKRFKTSL